jgi:hypothetical protein
MHSSRKRKDTIEERLSEFTLKSFRLISRPDELAPLESKLVEEWAERIMGDREEFTSFFEHRSSDWNFDKIRTMEFDWTHDGVTQTLLDINKWNGQDGFHWQTGAVALDGQIVLTNSDSQLTETELAPDQLKGRIKAYQHLREQECVDRNYDEGYAYDHKHCHSTYLKSLQLERSS